MSPLVLMPPSFDVSLAGAAGITGIGAGGAVSLSVLVMSGYGAISLTGVSFTAASGATGVATPWKNTFLGEPATAVIPAGSTVTGLLLNSDAKGNFTVAISFTPANARAFITAVENSATAVIFTDDLDWSEDSFGLGGCLLYNATSLNLGSWTSPDGTTYNSYSYWNSQGSGSQTNFSLAPGGSMGFWSPALTPPSRSSPPSLPFPATASDALAIQWVSTDGALIYNNFFAASNTGIRLIILMENPTAVPIYQPEVPNFVVAYSSSGTPSNPILTRSYYGPWLGEG